MNYNMKSEKVLDDLIFLEKQIKEQERKITNAQQAIQSGFKHHNISEKITVEVLEQLINKSISESQKKISEIQDQIKYYLQVYPQVEPQYILHLLTLE